MKRRETPKLRTWKTAAVATVALGTLGACSATPEDIGTSEPTDEAKSEILNGEVVTDADVHVKIETPGGGLCSGTLLNERWIVTAKHCRTVAGGSWPTTLTRGSDRRTAAQVVNHPTLDVTLIQASSPFPNVFPTSMYPSDPSTLVDRIAVCYGYGDNAIQPETGFGILRKGVLRVRFIADNIVLVPADGNRQIALRGDSGGGCFTTNKARALIGVGSYGTGETDSNGNIVRMDDARYVPTSAFSRWALPIIASSTQRLICHGRECITNPRPLPNRVNEEVAWQPCPGQLSAPGNYSFDYEITYDMELNFDKILLDGQFWTGSGTRSATTYASHFGHRVGLYTDGSVASNGISWLRARCPDDPTGRF